MAGPADLLPAKPEVRALWVQNARVTRFGFSRPPDARGKRAVLLPGSPRPVDGDGPGSRGPKWICATSCQGGGSLQAEEGGHKKSPQIPLLSGKSQVLEDPGSRLAGLGQLPRRRRFTSAGRRARRSGSNRHPAPETIFEDGNPPCAHAPPSPRAGTAGPPPRRPPCRLPGSSSAR